jgi:hypothetical protein
MLLFPRNTRSVMGPAGILTTLLMVLPLLLACSSRTGLRASDIDRTADSVVLGRISVRLAANCGQVIDLPRLELRNVAQRTAVPYQIHHLVLSQGERRIDLPITEKVEPGTYDIRIRVVEESWDPTWLDAGMLTLARFEVPKGFLVYFGTIDIDVACEGFGKRGQAGYAEHTIGDQYELELTRFKTEYPEILRMYQGRIIRSVADNPWIRS